MNLTFMVPGYEKSSTNLTRTRNLQGNALAMLQNLE